MRDVTTPGPLRSEVWLVDFGTPLGHEAGLRRPAIVITGGPRNPHQILSVVPCTTTSRGYPSHVELQPGPSGLTEVSFAQVELTTTISSARLIRRLGRLDAAEMQPLERVLRMHFGL